MNKAVKIILIVFGVLILIAVIAGVYFYYFHIFKTLRICIKQESSDLMINCSSDNYCYDFVKGKAGNYSEEDLKKLPDFIKEKIENSQDKAEALKESFEQLDNAPKFLSNMLNNIINEVLYCDSTCRYKEFYGSAPLGSEDVDLCQAGEKEFSVKIHGKEALTLAGWFKGISGSAIWDV